MAIEIIMKYSRASNLGKVNESSQLLIIIRTVKDAKYLYFDRMQNRSLEATDYYYYRKWILLSIYIPYKR